MIKNERQYRITQAQAKKFKEALASLPAPSDREPVHPALQRAQAEALKSQLAELEDQLTEYEAIASGTQKVLELDSIADLPIALIKARIACNMSQKDLAERIGLKEQQIQRYEATDYASASLNRMLEIVHALDINIHEDVFLPAANVSGKELFDRLGKAGLPREFVDTRLIPRTLRARLESANGEEQPVDAIRAAACVGRVFGWRPSQVFGPAPLQLSTESASLARFKVSSRAEARFLSAYIVYAHYLALLTIPCASRLPKRQIPTKPDKFREAVLRAFRSVSFENVLRFVWDLGVIVLPLSDPGAFHGACWRAEGRNVIVLKQGTRSTARWLHDLLHEVWHAAQDPGEEELALVESPEMSPERRESAEEQAATKFAGDVLLDGRAEQLAECSVTAAKGRIEYLKSVVPRIAREENVRTDVLANYLAFRLSMQGQNWWGAANNLQEYGPDPYQIARDVMLERLNLGALNEIDRQLLLQSLSEVQEVS